MLLTDIEEAGEESGREECACDLPNIPKLSELSDEQRMQLRRKLTRYGRAIAQGLYELRGKRAKLFAQKWAMGYIANCDLFELEGYLT